MDNVDSLTSSSMSACIITFATPVLISFLSILALLFVLLELSRHDKEEGEDDIARMPLLGFKSNSHVVSRNHAPFRVLYLLSNSISFISFEICKAIYIFTIPLAIIDTKLSGMWNRKVKDDVDVRHLILTT